MTRYSPQCSHSSAWPALASYTRQSPYPSVSPSTSHTTEAQKENRRTYLKQIRCPEHRSPRKMPRINTHDEHLLTPLLRPVLRHVLRMLQVVVHADKRAADIGLLVQMGQAEARKRRCVVEDRGLVLGAESGRKRVPGLCG